MEGPFRTLEYAGRQGWHMTSVFPYVNGGLFSASVEVPRFSKIARSYLLHIGKLDWSKINPDIFGSMIQAVAGDEERGALGMHDETLERIYIGRRFKNDIERLEKLFELYTKMTANAPAKKAAPRKKGGKR